MVPGILLQFEVTQPGDGSSASASLKTGAATRKTESKTVEMDLATAVRVLEQLELALAEARSGYYKRIERNVK
jgi:hypothetical protein